MPSWRPRWPSDRHRSQGRATVRSEDLAGLRHLSHRLGTGLVAGYVLHTGQQTLPFGDGLRALPIDALWNTTP
jgi:hypothetical protein